MSVKKGIALFIGVLVAICMAPTTFYVAQAGVSDTFLVTASGAYLEMNIPNASWAIGTVAMSTSYYTNDSYTIVVDTHNSTAAYMCDFPMTISTDSATWKTVYVENDTAGADQYKLNATSDAWATQQALNLTVYADVDNDFDPANNVSLDLRFDAPTSTTTGAAQSITLTGKIEVH